MECPPDDRGFFYLLLMISYWATAKQVKKDIDRTSVEVLLERIKSGLWKDQVELIRSETDKDRIKLHKLTLPCVTIGGVFYERSESKLEKHSGFICIDIDGYNDRSRIDIDEYTYASFISVSGNGIAVICKVDPEKHKDSYRFISEYYFKTYGIVVDDAPKNVASCRFVSFDENLFINPKSKKLKVKVEPKRSTIKNLALIIPKGEIGDLIREVNSSVVDEYSDYLNLSFALAVGFGEEGREYFHALSSFSSKYSFEQAEKQYSIALKGKNQGITVGTFYYYLKQAGVDLSKFQSDKAISELKLNKRINTPKVQAISELAKSKGIEIDQATEIVNEVYSRNDMDIRHEGGAESLIVNLTTFITKKYNLKKNTISRKYEWNGVPMVDKDFNSIFLDCRITFDDTAVTFDLVNRIIVSMAIPDYNPLFDYVNNNKHRISVGNIDTICKSVTSSTPIKDRFIRKWMIGIIACMYGNPVRYVLALTGGQNTGKTEWFRRLLPTAIQPYYAESNLDRGKDDELLMCEKLIVMDDEMGGKSKQDEKKFKELTSKSYFSLRAAYGRYNEDYKRLAILCGTSNDHQLISDSTGNTRILPVNVDTINHDSYNSVDKDDLFMELHRAYTSGENYQLEKTELDILNEVGRGFESIPFERELIYEHFSVPRNHGEWLSATQIKDYVEASSKQRILSMKKLGSELRNIFGVPKFKDRQNKYYVEKIKTEGNYDTTSIPTANYKSDSQPF